ncbi:hypothetical protein JQK87_06200 [Streptomyces sp. G44]|uniref:hypothetical protein n=1 Tax=Streptomyces sp. G44 TaxID=2807632 RepID=UPI0019618463|nr:hypothetical protein [Streptomyces sp. G44]MBM7168007.1 hypothetical protein [Streptomyces sp. G44]
MAHAAPAFRTPRTRRSRTTSSAARWAGIALTMGVVYGLWAGLIRRDGGPLTAGSALFGVVAGLVFAALMYALHRVAPTLPRELRAMSWATFAGISFGFLVSAGGTSVVRSTVFGLLAAASVFAVTFYRYYTTE